MNSRFLRISALLVAIVALAVLGWNARHPLALDLGAGSAAAIWTPGAQFPADGGTGDDFALPGFDSLPKGVSPIPDVAFLRQTRPEIRSVSIYGDGVGSEDAAALRGLKITWVRATGTKKTPELSSLTWSERLAIGQTFSARGVVDFPEAAATLLLTLESPDGAIQTLEMKGAVGARTPFTITSAAAVAPGRFEWKLRAGNGSPVLLNALVVAPLMPKVLLLEASPKVEVARLQRWLLASGAEVSSRILVSTDRLRASSNVPNVADVTTVNAGLLAKYDVVVTSDAGLLQLKPAERTALENAIRQGRLGLLVIGESVVPGPIDSLSPWHGIGLAKPENGADTTLARVRLANGVELPEPAAQLSGTLTQTPLSFALARDPAGQTLVAAVKRGLGTVARSRIVDTWHWLQDGQASTHAAYWSSLLTTLARPASAPKGRWQIADRSGEPLFVDRPIYLIWHRGEIDSPQSAQVIGEGSVLVTLPLQASRRESAVAYSTFWPVNPGWHEVRAGSDGASFSFYVQPKDSLPGVRAEERRRITALAVEDAKSADGNNHSNSSTQWSRRRVEIIAFALFVLCVSYLWFLQRRRRPD